MAKRAAGKGTAKSEHMMPEQAKSMGMGNKMGPGMMRPGMGGKMPPAGMPQKGMGPGMMNGGKPAGKKGKK